MSPTSKLRRLGVLALAGGSLAIGVPAALAAGGGDAPGAGSAAPAAAPSFVQDEQAQPNREDCPERGGGSGSGSASETAPGSSTAL